MNFEPMLNKKLKNFAAEYEKTNLNESNLYRDFVNYTVLKSFQPGAFNASNSICDIANVDGKDDMGIDTIAVCVNGMLISSVADIENIVKESKSYTATFVFIQSKRREKIETSEYGKFADGVEDFLSEIHNEPHNDDIAHWLEIKDYIFGDGVANLSSNPDIELFFACQANYGNDVHVSAKEKNLIQHIKNLKSYGSINSRFLNDEELIKLSDENENKFKVTLELVDSLQIQEVDGISSSEIILVNASEIVKMMTLDDGRMRKSLFDDNVRDYQGDTGVNQEILETLQNSPSYFSLMNNGITITCDTENSRNRKAVITNPHIVNGCQTCSTIFRASKNNINLSNVLLVVKLIATDNDEITNQIVRATNRQNIVPDESFETTREFHKRLEDFFASMPSEKNCLHPTYYYERRAKQYNDNASVTVAYKVNFRVLIQTVVSLFLRKPYDGSLHQSILIKRYREILFVDGQSFYPYYVAPCLELKLESIYKNRPDKKLCFTYRSQLLLIFSILAVGFPPNIENVKVDDYCKKLEVYLTMMKDKELKEFVDRTVETFHKLSSGWVKVRGTSYRYGYKDNSDFTNYIVKNIRNYVSSDLLAADMDESEEIFFRGKVCQISKRSDGTLYGVINQKGKREYFDANNNSEYNLNELIFKTVIYKENMNADGKRCIKIQRVCDE
mgnify:CR=1 FL=1